MHTLVVLVTRACSRKHSWTAQGSCISRFDLLKFLGGLKFHRHDFLAHNLHFINSPQSFSQFRLHMTTFASAYKHQVKAGHVVSWPAAKNVDILRISSIDTPSCCLCLNGLEMDERVFLESWKNLGHLADHGHVKFQHHQECLGYFWTFLLFSSTAISYSNSASFFIDRVKANDDTAHCIFSLYHDIVVSTLWIWLIFAQ